MRKRIIATLMILVMTLSMFIGCLITSAQIKNDDIDVTGTFVVEVNDPDIGTIIVDPYQSDEITYATNNELRIQEATSSEDLEFTQYICNSKEEAFKVIEQVFAIRQRCVDILFPEQEKPVLAKRFLYDSFNHDINNPIGGDYLFGFIQKVHLVSNDIYEIEGKRYHRISYIFDYMIDVDTEEITDIAVNRLLNTPRFKFINEYGTDYKKLMTIHNWLKENVKYDYWYWALPKERHNLVYTAYSAIYIRETVCKGYALAFYRLALSMGVDARYVRGITVYDSSVTHAWNMARIEDKYYFFDPTWDSQRWRDMYTEKNYYPNKYFAKNQAFFDTEHITFTDELVDFSKYNVSEESYITEDIIERVDKAGIEYNTYYYDALLWGLKEGIIEGYDDDNLGVRDNCTREQVITLLYRAAGSPEIVYSVDANPYMDVDPRAYYSDAVAWGAYYGITNGVATDKFGVGLPCSRAELATFIWRYYGYQLLEGEINYDDVVENSYYEDAVKWTTEVGLFFGTDVGTFSPHIPVKRQDVFTVLHRAPF